MNTFTPMKNCPGEGVHGNHKLASGLILSYWERNVLDS